jgi:aldehyde dehydrogenase (NAD+)
MPVRECLEFYIDGRWSRPAQLEVLDVENPATEQVAGQVALGSATGVDQAVTAARKASGAWERTSREERLQVMDRIQVEYRRRSGDLAAAITEEMGAPSWLARDVHVPSISSTWASRRRSCRTSRSRSTAARH